MAGRPGEDATVGHGLRVPVRALGAGPGRGHHSDPCNTPPCRPVAPARARRGDRTPWVADSRLLLGYSALGYLVIELVPTGDLIRLLGDNPLWGVPLAALLGIPIYLSTEASLPMVAALVRGGLGSGPAMAFLISGAGTSVGAITGALLIARRRVVGLVVALVFAGAAVLGWAAAVAL